MEDKDLKNLKDGLDRLNKGGDDYMKSILAWNRFLNYLRFLGGVMIGVLIMYFFG